MRLLVACPSCRRQYDAAGLGSGGLFRCLCGETLAAPDPRPHDAAVVRCSSCGGPREGGALSCIFCGAEFSLHERDLQTICPGCMARISDRARYCHHCAHPILPAGSAGEASALPCPACGAEIKLHSRALGDLPASVLECPRCAGLWLGNEAFRFLLERSRQGTPGGWLGSEMPRPSPIAPFSQPAGPAYRPCPVCSQLMHRRNFGPGSGVILDTCRADGLWFDAAELDTVLRWVQAGGEDAAGRREESARRERERRERLLSRDVDWDARSTGGATVVDLLAWLLGAFSGR